jgi:hypothetical protein
VHELKNPSRIRKEVKAQEELAFSYSRRSSESKSCKRRKKTKVEAFEELEILPSLGRSTKAQKGAQQPSNQIAKRSGPLKISTSREHQEECTKGEIVDHRMFT